jgi:acetyl esterase
VPIHPWLLEKFELIRDIPSFEAASADPRFGARFLDYLQDPAPWTPPAGVTIEEAVAGNVPLKVFRPPGAPTSALLWMHGGGFVSGTIDDTESVIPGAELAARSGALVVSVGYRLALGGVRFPAPLDDVLTAWEWLGEHAGVAPDRLFAGGASVGGNLATAAAVRLRDARRPMPRGLLLAYPLLHFPVPPTDAALLPDLEKLPAMLRFPQQYQLGIVHNYAGRVDDLPADIVPGNHPLDGLPETWIAPGEYDDLRSSGDLFAEQLRDAGIPVHVEVARGMVHGHLGRGPSLEPVSATLDFFAGALR